MPRKAAGRQSRTGTIERRGNIYLARWMVNGKRFCRSTGTGVKSDALKKLKEFTNPYKLKDEKRIIETQIARVKGLDQTLSDIENAKPSLGFKSGWSAFLESTSRPRSGEGTLRNYEQQYMMFVDWVTAFHPELHEMREVNQTVADEYARVLLNGLTKDQLDAIKASPAVIKQYEASIAQHSPDQLPEKEPDPVRKARLLVAYKVHDPVRGTTYNRHVNALGLVWRHAGQHPEARITMNPWMYDKGTGKGIRRIKLNHAERPHSRRALTLDEVYRLIDAAEGEMKILIALGFYTGLRLGDAALLEWSSIDRVKGIIDVRSRKTDTETVTAIHPALATIIQTNAAPEEKRHGYVMPNIAKEYNRGLTGRCKVSVDVTRLFNSIGIKTVEEDENGKRGRSLCGFHSLRHTFVSEMRNRGAALHTAQLLAGHHTAAMTEHYTHDDGRAVLILPDMTDKDAATAPALPAPRPFTVADLKGAWDSWCAADRAEAIAFMKGKTA